MAQYRIVELSGSSEVSWDDAARKVLAAAAETIDDVGAGEVTRLDVHIGQGGKIFYDVKLRLSFDL
jgi:dodecin